VLELAARVLVAAFTIAVLIVWFYWAL